MSLHFNVHLYASVRSAIGRQRSIVDLILNLWKRNRGPPEIMGFQIPSLLKTFANCYVSPERRHTRYFMQQTISDISDFTISLSGDLCEATLSRSHRCPLQRAIHKSLNWDLSASTHPAVHLRSLRITPSRSRGLLAILEVSSISIKKLTSSFCSLWWETGGLTKRKPAHHHLNHSPYQWHARCVPIPFCSSKAATFPGVAHTIEPCCLLLAFSRADLVSTSFRFQFHLLRK